MSKNQKKNTKALPVPAEKPSLLDYLEEYLPFKIPRIPYPQTAKNLDKAAARLIHASSRNIVERIGASTQRIKSRSKAEIDVIEAGARKALVAIADGNRELAERAIDHALTDSIQKQKNRESILQITAEELEASPVTEEAKTEIEDDWLNMFSAFAEDKTDADIQTLWGKILAGEIRTPGSYSLRTLSSLATLTTEEANFAYDNMKLVIDGAFIYSGNNDEFLSVDHALLLEEMGLVTGIAGLIGRETRFKQGQEVLFRNHNVAVKLIPKKDYKKTYSCTLLSEFGKQLFKLCGRIEGNLSYMKSFASDFIHENCDAFILALGEADSARRRKILSEEPLVKET